MEREHRQLASSHEKRRQKARASKSNDATTNSWKYNRRETQDAESKEETQTIIKDSKGKGE